MRRQRDADHLGPKSWIRKVHTASRESRGVRVGNEWSKVFQKVARERGGRRGKRKTPTRGGS